MALEKQYARAIENLLARGGTDKQTVTDLAAHLAKTGRTKLLPKILTELRVLEARKGHLSPVVEVASEKESARAIADAKKEGIEVAKARVNHALISGWRARKGGKLVDRSAKQGLIELYRKVTD